MIVRSARVGRLLGAGALAALLLAPPGATALPRFGDPVQAGEARFLRDSKDPHLYHALPAAPRLATDAGGKPRFSLLEFSFRGDDGGTNAGALLNFLLTWGLDDEGQAAAERELRRIDPEARIAGSLNVREGRYRVLVDHGDARWVLAEGEASLLPGQPIAFSRRLQQKESEKLAAALDSDDAVVAVGFLLTVEALGAPVKASLSIDWDLLSAREDLAVLGATSDAPAGDAGVRAAFDRLRGEGVVRVDAIGDDVEAAIEEGYRHFRDAVFESVVGAGDAGLEVRYARRETRQSGRFRIEIDGSRSERRQLLIRGDITEAIRGALADAVDANAVSSER